MRTPAPSCTDAAGTAGTSTGVKRSTRPWLVTAPTSVRVVVASDARIASCLLRRAGTVILDPASASTRTARPVVDTSSTVGASAICRSADDLVERTFGGAALSSMVRRGVPNVSETASSSRETWARTSAGSESSVSSSAISFSSLSRSASSSMRENLVRRRRRSSRMYSAWTSSRSNTVCSRARAVSESSEVRMTWMTSSMSRIATSSPRTRCSRSLRRSRRYLLRRVTTSTRCCRYTSSSSRSPRVRGWPSTSATLLMEKESSSGV